MCRTIIFVFYHKLYHNILFFKLIIVIVFIVMNKESGVIRASMVLEFINIHMILALSIPHIHILITSIREIATYITYSTGVQIYLGTGPYCRIIVLTQLCRHFRKNYQKLNSSLIFISRGEVTLYFTHIHTRAANYTV